MIHEREYVKVRYFNIIPRTTSAESYIGEKMFPSNAKPNRGSHCLVNGIGFIGRYQRLGSCLRIRKIRDRKKSNIDFPSTLLIIFFVDPYPPTAIHYI